MSKILLIEDDKFISRAYQLGLSKAGFEVVEMYDGAEVIEKAVSEKPDLILLDLILPGKNGFEVLEEIKMNDALNSIPVVIVSNLGQEADVEKGKALGAVDYIIKANFTMKEVVLKVKEHLAKGQVRQAA